MMKVITSSDFINIKKSFNIHFKCYPYPRRGGGLKVELKYFSASYAKPMAKHFIPEYRNYFPATLFIIISVAGLIKSFNQYGAIPIAMIPAIKITATNFSFHRASFKLL